MSDENLTSGDYFTRPGVSRRETGEGLIDDSSRRSKNSASIRKSGAGDNETTGDINRNSAVALISSDLKTGPADGDRSPLMVLKPFRHKSVFVKRPLDAFDCPLSSFISDNNIGILPNSPVKYDLAKRNRNTITRNDVLLNSNATRLFDNAT